VALNEALLSTAVEARVVKTGKVRADTTVVSANVEYPTDSGLLAKAVVKIGKLVRRVKAAGGATRTGFFDLLSSVGKTDRSAGERGADDCPAQGAPITRPSIWCFCTTGSSRSTTRQCRCCRTCSGSAA
jgi:hypothetical protein